LNIVDGFRLQGKVLRRFYNDIWDVQKILFATGQTKSGAKRQLFKLRKAWEKRAASPRCQADTEETEMLSNWCEQTDSYWPGLFHTYSDFRLPGTSNDIERYIKDQKQRVRQQSRNPNPARRFIRNAATNAVVSSRPVLPDKDDLATRSAQEWGAAQKELAARRQSLTAQQQARRTPKKYTERFLERWRTIFHKLRLQKPTGPGRDPAS
jgi:hypothetical protein